MLSHKKIAAGILFVPMSLLKIGTTTSFVLVTMTLVVVIVPILLAIILAIAGFAIAEEFLAKLCEWLLKEMQEPEFPVAVQVP